MSLFRNFSADFSDLFKLLGKINYMQYSKVTEVQISKVSNLALAYTDEGRGHIMTNVGLHTMVYGMIFKGCMIFNSQPTLWSLLMGMVKKVQYRNQIKPTQFSAT